MWLGPSKRKSSLEGDETIQAKKLEAEYQMEALTDREARREMITTTIGRVGRSED